MATKKERCEAFEQGMQDRLNDVCLNAFEKDPYTLEGYKFQENKELSKLWEKGWEYAHTGICNVMK